MNTLLITQARMGSTRLPGKVLKEVEGKPLLQIHLDRLSRCKKVTKIIVATTLAKEDEQIVKLAEKWRFQTFRGSEEDVLDRFYQAAKPHKPDWIVRVTSDCPLLGPELIDNIMEYAHHHEADYVCNSIESPYPDGQDVEVFTFDVLEKAWKEADKHSEREHVTPYIWKNADFMGGDLFKGLKYPSEEEYGQVRMSVDEQEDYELIKKLVKDLGTEKTWKEYADYMLKNNLTAMNKQYKRNEGYYKSLKKDQ